MPIYENRAGTAYPLSTSDFCPSQSQAFAQDIGEHLARRNFNLPFLAVHREAQPIHRRCFLLAAELLISFLSFPDPILVGVVCNPPTWIDDLVSHFTPDVPGTVSFPQDRTASTSKGPGCCKIGQRRPKTLYLQNRFDLVQCLFHLTNLIELGGSDKGNIVVTSLLQLSL
jgi:hypothetical protein